MNQALQPRGPHFVTIIFLTLILSSPVYARTCVQNLTLGSEVQASQPQLRIKKSVSGPYGNWSHVQINQEIERIRDTLISIESSQRAAVIVEFFAVQTIKMISHLEHSLNWNYRSPQLGDRIPTIQDENGVLITGPWTVKAAVEHLIREAQARVDSDRVTYGWFLDFSSRYVQVMDYANFHTEADKQSEAISPFVAISKRREAVRELPDLKATGLSYMAFVKDALVYLPLFLSLDKRIPFTRHWFLGARHLGLTEMQKGFDGRFRATMTRLLNHDYNHSSATYTRLNPDLLKKRREFLDSLNSSLQEEVLFILFYWDHEGVAYFNNDSYMKREIEIAIDQQDIPPAWEKLNLDQVWQRYLILKVWLDPIWRNLLPPQ